MPAKKTSKPRTSKNRLNKKKGVPNWVIGVVLLIVVGTGAFLVYKSFASPSYVDGSQVYCYNGWCRLELDGSGNQDGKRCQSRPNKATRWYCTQ